MKKPFWLLLILTSVITAGAVVASAQYINRFTDQEFELLGEDLSDDLLPFTENPYANWTRPPGPVRVGLQVGHWQNEQFPEELKRLRTNGGASGGGRAEWEVNLTIVQEAAKLLQEQGIAVDIIPATVPPDYWADLFVAVHADGSPNPEVSGFKVATPRRDLTGRGSVLTAIFEEEYGEVTGLPIDPNVTRNMRGYYAFNFRRYEHSIHPMTPALILETGFLTSYDDQRILIRRPATAAQGLANAVVKFLEGENLISN